MLRSIYTKLWNNGRVVTVVVREPKKEAKKEDERTKKDEDEDVDMTMD